jgi:hypothetical protein
VRIRPPGRCTGEVPRRREPHATAPLTLCGKTCRGRCRSPRGWLRLRVHSTEPSCHQTSRLGPTPARLSWRRRSGAGRGPPAERLVCQPARHRASCEALGPSPVAERVVRSGGQKVASCTSRSSGRVGVGTPIIGGLDAYPPTGAPPDAVTPLHLRSDEPRAQIRARVTLSRVGAKTTTYQTSPSRWLWPESRRAMRSCAVLLMSGWGWCAYSASSPCMS